MNSRDYKIFRPGCYYHIYNRGNNKQAIYLDNQDYENFLRRLKLILFPDLNLSFQSRIRVKPLPAKSYTLLAYCLMPNHFHFLIRQNSEIGIDRLMAKLCTSYVKYFNLKYNHIGNLFQDAFKAKLVDNDAYAKYLSAYIHNNPFRPLQYDYSSFKDYVGFRAGQLCEKSLILDMFNGKLEDYKNFVENFSQNHLNLVRDYIFEED